MTRKKAGMLLAGVLVLLGLGYAGCQYYLDHIRPPKVPPDQVITLYFQAIKQKDFKQAHALVSPQHYFESYNQFIDRVSMYPPDMKLDITGVTIKENMAAVTVKVEAAMKFGVYSSDSLMDLVRIKREWKIIHP